MSTITPATAANAATAATAATTATTFTATTATTFTATTAATTAATTTATPGVAIPRSYLFVPGDRPERFAKALASGADAVVLDLEDAVAPAAKAGARAAVGDWLRAASVKVGAAATTPGTAGRDVQWLVRINDAATPWFADDLAALAALVASGFPAPGVMLPKAEQPAQVAAVRQALPASPVLALVESAAGVANVDAVAAAPGVSRLAFGTLDFALDLSIDITDDPAGLAYAASRIAIASRAAGLAAPVAGVTPDLKNEARLLADLAWARRLGFGAKLCIHPAQVAPLHAALRPGDDELAWARRVLDAVAANPVGAVQLDGRMVDRPVLLRAQALLARAGR